MMVEPGYEKCPDCGAPLKQKEVFKEVLIQCTKCDYKRSHTLEEQSIAENVLEESW